MSGHLRQALDEGEQVRLAVHVAATGIAAAVAGSSTKRAISHPCRSGKDCCRLGGGRDRKASEHARTGQGFRVYMVPGFDGFGLLNVQL